MSHPKDRVLAAVEALRQELVEFAAELVRIPTLNPPGEAYEDCAHAIGDRLQGFGFEVEYLAAEGRPEHTRAHPRVNVVGMRRGERKGRTLHLNGHFDVVPAGEGWSVPPFAGLVRDGRLYGRGSGDMKAGIAASAFAAEAIRRAGVPLAGAIEVSGTVDEESGGWAGVAWLAERGRISRERVDFAIIPEPLQVDRICIGHRGVYWLELTTHGRIAHGSMPFLGRSAISDMGALLEAVRTELLPQLASRHTRMPVVPEAAGRATLNVNALEGGQPADGVQTPCVADRCRAVFDRRFLIEEGLEAARDELAALFERTAARVAGLRYSTRELMVVHPVQTPEGSPVVGSLQRSIASVLGREACLVASPGTYDHKHFARIGGVEHCVAYGPGILELAHQPDEYCELEDIVNATKVLALSALELTGST